jgi:hypothetical protein
MNSKKSNEPFIEARAALDLLFRQAQGLPPPRSYTPAPAYKPVTGGDPAAIEAYAHLVREHVEKLNSLIATHRDLLLPYSQKCFNWPVRLAKRKPFGDDADNIIRKLHVGAETIANDPNARFNPNGKFGRIAMSVLERIEHCKTTPLQWLQVRWMLSNTDCRWASSARTLPPFPRRTVKPTSDDEDSRLNWLAVAKQVLEDDFRKPERGEIYRRLMACNVRQDERYFIGKVCAVFQSFWDKDRKAKG